MSTATPISQDEVFRSQYGWFLGHVASLALEPDACCESQGKYNVAHELWYFIRNDQLPRNVAGMLSEAQWTAVDDLCRSVAAVPKEARRWTTIASESVENMRNGAWRPCRAKAQDLLEILVPVTQLLS
jgi:hypothetical protein